MGYFSNGCEGESYHAQYCSHCVHWNQEAGCPVWNAHSLFNYKECNNPESILHLLIPRDEKGWNKQCLLFMTKEKRSYLRNKNQQNLPLC